MKTKITWATHKGNRGHQEDRVYIHSDNDGTLLAIFDGHGGDEVSQFCANATRIAFDTVAVNPSLPTIEDKLRGLFKYLALHTNSMSAGSTATIAFIPPLNNKIWVGVLGDSPVIVKIDKNQIWKGPEHNVRSNPEEARLAKMRGCTIYGGYMYAPRPAYGGLSAGGLQLSRAFGDADMGDAVLREPEIFELPLTESSFILLGSDGLLDPSHESSSNASTVTNLIESRPNVEAQDLVNWAVSVPTNDNASAILVRMGD